MLMADLILMMYEEQQGETLNTSLTHPENNKTLSDTIS